MPALNTLVNDCSVIESHTKTLNKQTDHRLDKMTEKKFNSENNFLKTYIMKQRFKKKQGLSSIISQITLIINRYSFLLRLLEMETSISLQKQKREEEMKRYRVQMNLDEIKSELNKLESKLRELKDQKHQLFSQLKKVLHEDDMRKRQWNANHAFFTAEQLGPRARSSVGRCAQSALRASHNAVVQRSGQQSISSVL